MTAEIIAKAMLALLAGSRVSMSLHQRTCERGFQLP